MKDTNISQNSEKVKQNEENSAGSAGTATWNPDFREKMISFFSPVWEEKEKVAGSSAGLLDRARVHAHEKIERSFCMRSGQHDLAGLGGLVVVSGEAKSGKTSFSKNLAMAAAGSAGDWNCSFGVDILGLEKVIYIDTEQDRYDSLALKKSCEKIDVLNVLDFSIEERISVFEIVCTENKNGLVVLDGISDFVADVNSIQEASFIVDLLRKNCVENNVLLVCIIHVTRGHGQSRGHLGSELIRKCSLSLQVQRDQNTHRVILERSRHVNIPPGAVLGHFEWSEILSRHVGVEKEIVERKAAITEEKIEEIRAAIAGKKYEETIVFLRTELSITQSQARKLYLENFKEKK